MTLLSSCVRRTGAFSDTALLLVRELRVFLCRSLHKNSKFKTVPTVLKASF